MASFPIQGYIASCTVPETFGIVPTLFFPVVFRLFGAHPFSLCVVCVLCVVFVVFFVCRHHAWKHALLLQEGFCAITLLCRCMQTVIMCPRYCFLISFYAPSHGSAHVSIVCTFLARISRILTLRKVLTLFLHRSERCCLHLWFGRALHTTTRLVWRLTSE